MNEHSGLVLEYSHLDETSSTNDFLRNYTPSADISIVSASFQTKGRGQMGNTWISHDGQNALFSVLVCPKSLKASDGFVLSQAMALAIKETLEEYVDDVWIKWPNDIYCHGKKICGTLIENTLMGKFIGRSVIGNGINVNQTDFPDGLAAPPTSMCIQSGKECSTHEVIRHVVERFALYYREIMDASYERIRTLYHENMYLRGKKSLFQDSEGMFTGIISHVETDGHLVIIDEQSQSRRYAFKQVQFIRDDKD
jgi:BirA family biotin operon repressor/biotin-[acetyl-CoA-carboxylase] ligase